jgi:hypothetical protein
VLDLVLMPDDYAVCRLNAGDAVPTGLDAGKGVVSITWTETELSIICPSNQAPPRGSSHSMANASGSAARRTLH